MNASKPYHKEHLRQDLLDAGREYLKNHGHVTLSIRTLATQVGVSPGAPYHHFADRRALLFALAAEGFKDMMAGTNAVESGNMKPEVKLHRMGILFIRFAEQNTRLLDLMYESELTTPSLDPELLQFQMMGHEALRKQIVAAVPGLSAEEANLRVIVFWSTIYGFVTMRKKGVIHHGNENVPSTDIAEAIVSRAIVAAVAA